MRRRRGGKTSCYPLTFHHAHQPSRRPSRSRRGDSSCSSTGEPTRLHRDDDDDVREPPIHCSASSRGLRRHPRPDTAADTDAADGAAPPPARPVRHHLYDPSAFDAFRQCAVASILTPCVAIRTKRLLAPCVVCIAHKASAHTECCIAHKASARTVCCIANATPRGRCLVAGCNRTTRRRVVIRTHKKTLLLLTPRK